MSRRVRLLLAAAALRAAAGALATLVLLGPLSPRRQLAAGLSRATGLACTIGSLAPCGEGFEVRDLSLGAEPGLRIEVDRLEATGDLARRELRTLTMTRGSVRLVLPGEPALRLTEVDLSAGNLEGLTGRGDGGPASLAVSGLCFDLNPVLKAHGRLRFLRGRFTLSCSLARPGDAPLDVPVRVLLTDFHVQSLDGRYQGEAGSAEAAVRVTGSLRNPQLDARELAPILGGIDLSRRKQ
jgi:hypothetical protein